MAVLILAGVAGCTPPRGPVRISDPDPSVKIVAIKRAGENKDRSKVPLLVEQLDSDDPAVRFYAIEALRIITGEDLGYLYYESAVDRRPAIERWGAWLKRNPVEEP